MAEISNNPNNYPIYIGPLYLCCSCQTMYISEEFLNKHQKKCIHKALISIFKSKLLLESNPKYKDVGNSTRFIQKYINSTENYLRNESSARSLNSSESIKQMNLHHSATFQCDHCDRNFTKKSLLKGHVRRVHQKATNQFICDICAKSLSSKPNLVVHLRIHSDERHFACTYCSKKYLRNGDLKIHLRKHKGEKPFQCAECLKKFTLKGDLNRHFRIHTGEKPYQCDECLKIFSLKGALDRHLRIHTGEKPFECTQCLKKFSQKSTLNQHLKIHFPQ